MSVIYKFLFPSKPDGTAMSLLVLFTKSLSFYAITFRKHTDAHRSRFNLLLLKKKRTQN